MACSEKASGCARALLADRQSLVDEVGIKKAQLINKEVEAKSIKDAIAVYRIESTRVELLESGPIWERIEWQRRDNEWVAPTRLLPY
mmetsp:Transcript_13259/g.15102  ORF Transcript_13259/g.15102 Transcript_13259/m.15102 type:complete len:87 (+) Transcript_13259:289-549(+)